MIPELLWIGLGLVLLYYGAEFLVNGASSLALRLGLTPLVVGLTVVAFGTSAPEMVVSVKASLAGQGNLALGNVVGSNIFNIAIILGFSALICPMKVQVQLIRIDMPVLIGVTLLTLLLVSDRQLARWEGLLFLSGAVGYTLFALHLARRETSQEALQEFATELPQPKGPVWLDWVRIGGGIILLVGGGHALVHGSVHLARMLGISEAIIGLTIVATGTSLPELATSIVAALKKEADIAVGNVVGSNILNLLAILGVSATIHPFSAAGITALDLGTMVAVSLVLLPIMWTGFEVRRWEGALLLAAYGTYLFFLWPS
jgi:cation:H+ antiporter